MEVSRDQTFVLPLGPTARSEARSIPPRHDFAAWLRLVPVQHRLEAKRVLGKTSKMAASMMRGERGERDRNRTCRSAKFARLAIVPTSGAPHEILRDRSYEGLVSQNEQIGSAYRCTMAN
jgi:hypothetical protein